MFLRHKLEQVSTSHIGGGGITRLVELSLLHGQASFFLVFDHCEDITKLRQFLKTCYCHWRSGCGCLDRRTSVIEQSTHLAIGLPCHEEMPRCQAALLDKQVYYRATTLLHMCLNNEPLSRHVRIGAKLFHVGHKQDGIEQLINILASLSANWYHNGIATPLLRVEMMLTSKLSFDHIGIGRVFVNLVDSNDNLGIGIACKADCLYRLWLNTIIGCHNNHHHIGQCGTVLAQRRKGLMARGIKQRHRTTTLLGLIGTNVLGNTTSLTSNRLHLEDSIEQRCLAVVNMPHHRHNWRAWYSIARRLV